MKQKHKKLIKTIAKISFMIFLIVYFEVYGLVSIMIFFLILGLYRLFFVRWDDFIRTKQLIEATIWGKPLKDFEKGELKNHKVKIVWRKDKNETIKRNRTNKPNKKK